MATFAGCSQYQKESELVAESVAVVAIAAIDAIVAAFYDAFAVVAVPVAVDVAEFAPAVDDGVVLMMIAAANFESALIAELTAVDRWILRIA